MSIVQKYTYRMNSEHGTQLTPGRTTNTLFPLSQTVSLLSIGGMFQLRLHGITIPFSFYQLSSDINSLSCVFTDALGNSKTSTISLTPGNYTCASALVELQAKLFAEGSISSGSYIGTIFVFSFSYNSSTGKSTITLSNPAPVSIQLRFSTNTNLGLFFGFTADTTVSLATPRTSTQYAVANPVSYLLLRCSSLKQFHNREFIVNTDYFSDVVYRIPITTNQGTWIQYTIPSEPVFVVNNDITSFVFYLTTNLTTTPIDLQSLYYSFQFTIEEVLPPAYESLVAAKFINRPAGYLVGDQELEALIQQRDAELERLKIYQRKLAKEGAV